MKMLKRTLLATAVALPLFFSTSANAESVDLPGVNSATHIYELCQFTTNLISDGNSYHKEKVDRTLYINKGFTATQVEKQFANLRLDFSATQWGKSAVLKEIFDRLMLKVDDQGVQASYFSQKGSNYQYNGLTVKVPEVSLSYAKSLPRGKYMVWQEFTVNDLKINSKLPGAPKTFNIVLDIWQKKDAIAPTNRRFEVDIAEMWFDKATNTCNVLANDPTR